MASATNPLLTYGGRLVYTNPIPSPAGAIAPQPSLDFGGGRVHDAALVNQLFATNTPEFATQRLMDELRYNSPLGGGTGASQASFQEPISRPGSQSTFVPPMPPPAPATPPPPPPPAATPPSTATAAPSTAPAAVTQTQGNVLGPMQLLAALSQALPQYNPQPTGYPTFTPTQGMNPGALIQLYQWLQSRFQPQQGGR